MSSSLTRWNKQKPNRDASRVVSKTFREDMSSTASAKNIPNNHLRSSKAWIDDDVNTTCHKPIRFRQVMSPNPHSLEQRLVSDLSMKRWRRSAASQISISTLLHRLESVERQNEELRQRMSEMEHSNPSSIHGTETTSHAAGSLFENDTSMNQRESEHHEVISEPIRQPEIRRMTPSDDIESESDDLHLWYTTRVEMEQNSANLAPTNLEELALNSNENVDLSVSQNASSIERNRHKKFTLGVAQLMPNPV